MKHFDPNDLTPKEQYKLMTGSIVPRPIALVTTLGPEGANAAPFSLFNMVSVDPPTVMFSVSPRGQEIKDTVRNIEEHVPEFVVHIVNEATRERMNVTSADFPRGQSEIRAAGFLSVPSFKVQPPRLVECPVQLECRMLQVLRIGRRPTVMVIGEVVHFHFHEGLVNEELYVDAQALGAIGRMEGNGAYVRTTHRFTMGRPQIPGVPATSG